MKTLVINKDIHEDNLEKVNFVNSDGTVSQGYVITNKEAFEKAKIEKTQKTKDQLYIVFLTFGILSFALGAYTSYKRLKG
jgi:hypothetical protein